MAHPARKIPLEEVQAGVTCSPESAPIPADSLSQWQAPPSCPAEAEAQGHKGRLWEGLGTLPGCINVGPTSIPSPHTCVCLITLKLYHSSPRKKAENMRVSSENSPGNPRSWPKFQGHLLHFTQGWQDVKQSWKQGPEATKASASKCQQSLTSNAADRSHHAASQANAKQAGSK